MLIRRGGEGLQALQHLVATAFRRQLGDDTRVVVDCNGYRRDKDAELKQMAAFIAEKVRTTGASQETRTAQPLRTPHRPHGHRRRSDCHVREYRRRLHEDGDHRAEVEARGLALNEPAGSASRGPGFNCPHFVRAKPR